MISRSFAIGAAVFAVALALGSANAAPNLYSEAVDSGGARLQVVSPKAGLYKPGDELTIRWKKTTEGTDITITLYTATTEGLRDKKVQSIALSDAVRATFKATGGGIKWTLPSSLRPGRYVVVVKTKLDVATSEAFGVRAAEPPADSAAPAKKDPELGASRLDTAGTVKKADVQSRGAKGSVVIDAPGGDVIYEWGVGMCPELGGGLPGALATMAAIGNVKIEPRVREVTQEGKVLQRCIDGLIVKSGIPAQAAPAAEPSGS